MSYTSVERDMVLVRSKLAEGIVSGTNLAATANAPGDNTASVSLIGQKDSTVQSKATLDIETEEAVVTEASTPDTTIAVWVNGVQYKLPLEAV